jgi:hypothetical protein
MPRALPLIPRYESGGIRRRVVRDYSILYRIGEDTIQIVHIPHSARNYETPLGLANEVSLKPLFPPPPTTPRSRRGRSFWRGG